MQTAGVLERIKNGEQVADAILGKWLRSLYDEGGKIEERAPQELLRSRGKLFELMQRDQHHRDKLLRLDRDLALKRERLDLDKSRAVLEDDPETDGRHNRHEILEHTADCALRHGGEACDCTEIPDPDLELDDEVDDDDREGS